MVILLTWFCRVLIYWYIQISKYVNSLAFGMTLQGICCTVISYTAHIKHATRNDFEDICFLLKDHI